MQSPNQLGSPQLTSPLGNDLQRMNEELMNARSKLASWEESWTQAKQACDAWKKEAEASAERAKQAEQEKEEAAAKREEVSGNVSMNAKISIVTVDHFTVSQQPFSVAHIIRDFIYDSERNPFFQIHFIIMANKDGNLGHSICKM